MLEFLMSNQGVATLCRGRSWECEGIKANPLMLRAFRMDDATGLAMPYGQSQQCNGPERRAAFYRVALESQLTLDTNASKLAENTVRVHGGAGSKSSAEMGEKVLMTEGLPRGLVITETTFTPMAKYGITRSLKGVDAHDRAETARAIDTTTAHYVSQRSKMHEIIRSFAQFWNLSKPVLVDKTPHWFSLDFNEMHSAFTTYHDPEGALVTVRPVYTLMWRPLCISIFARCSPFRSKFALKQCH
jgi:hypothetical protein